jgi:hypothetical protein
MALATTPKILSHMHHSRFLDEKLTEYAHTGASKRLQKHNLNRLNRIVTR